MCLSHLLPCFFLIINFFCFLLTDSPKSYYFIHTISWVLNLFGIFFILAGHEHYSIDVFIAFYISTRLFLYYHALANNRALYQSDRARTKIWFPLFSFFESSVTDIVPNHFEDHSVTIQELSKAVVNFKAKQTTTKNCNNNTTTTNHTNHTTNHHVKKSKVN